MIERLPPSISVKCVRSFLGHAGFYLKFIEYFLKIEHPLCKLLMEECKFYVDGSCLKSFGELKEQVVSVAIIIPLIGVSHLRLCVMLVRLLLV